jgi:hypothetical protein
MANERFSTPGIYREETDLSEITQPVGNSTGAIVIDSNVGPINRRVLVSNDKEFIEAFGQPDGSKVGHYSALEFLKESNRLYVVRGSEGDGTELYSNFCVGETSAVSAVALVSAATLSADSSTNAIAGAYSDGDKSNDIQVIEGVTYPGDTFLCVAAVGPGTWGNNIGIRITTSADTPAVSGGNFDWKNKYDDNPDTDTDPLWKKVFKVDVFLKDAKASTFSSSLTPVETYYVTRTDEVDGNGRQLQCEQVINGASKYIYVKNDNTQNPGTVPISVGQTNPVGLTGGTNRSSALGQGNFQSSWDLFADRNRSTVNILIFPDEPTSANVRTTQRYVGDIAATRQDSIAVVQANANTYQSISDIISSTEFGFKNGSYVAIYAGYSLIYDKYNDKNIYLPNAAFGAQLMARTDNVANTWDAPAGINRGIINAVDQNRVFTDDEIGFLYDENINCVKKIEGIGFIMWGQKTAQKKSSALDRVNVRRLLLFLENTIEPSLLPFLFENNSEQNRLRVTTITDDFLSSVQAGGGLTKYQVVCDNTNNTADVIDANQMNVDVYVQPARTIEFIKLQTIITRTGVDFSEL